MRREILFFLLSFSFLFGKEIDTFYGPIDVEEPVLLELIEAPLFQRLKHIHQYGICYYISHKEEYTRYAHSIGVFAVLREKGRSLKEQIAGLLHDVSHTVFSHTGDWIFGKENQEKDYQSSTHLLFLKQEGIESILNKYGYIAEELLPEHLLFPALESPLPYFCADRIDYQIQGAYYQGFITYEEAIAIFKDLQFIEDRWISSNPDLIKKLVRFSLFMTEDCWGSPLNYVASRAFADAVLKGIASKAITYEELHFGIDQVVWDKLLSLEDPFIQKKMRIVLSVGEHIAIVPPEQGDFIVKSKWRGIDPWVLSGSQCVRITSTDPILAKEFYDAKERMEQGWGIKIISSNYLVKNEEVGELTYTSESGNHEIR